MKDYLESNHMNLAVRPPSNFSSCYYISHFCIFKPNIVSLKFRVVFDTSVTSPGGESLNQTLLVLNCRRSLLRSFFISLPPFWVHSGHTANESADTDASRVPSLSATMRLLLPFSFQDPGQEYQFRTVTYGLNSSSYLAIRVLYQLD